jgi:hypothetical protein
MSYLLYLCLFAHSGVHHIVCCVFVLFISSSCVPYFASFSGLSILIAPSVFSSVYLQYNNIKSIETEKIASLWRVSLDCFAASANTF